jgi:hypothetical protein
MIHHSDGAIPERVSSWLSNTFGLSIHRQLDGAYWLYSNAKWGQNYWLIPWEYEEAPTVAQALDALANRQSVIDGLRARVRSEVFTD